MKRLRRWLFWSIATLILISIIPVLVFRWVAPPTSAVMLTRTLIEAEQQDYQWVPLAHMSVDLPLAVMASEDQKFPDHFGFDISAIKDAVEQHAQG